LWLGDGTTATELNIENEDVLKCSRSITACHVGVEALSNVILEDNLGIVNSCTALQRCHWQPLGSDAVVDAGSVAQ